VALSIATSGRRSTVLRRGRVETLARPQSDIDETEDGLDDTDRASTIVTSVSHHDACGSGSVVVPCKGDLWNNGPGGRVSFPQLIDWGNRDRL
jgi:hypothetical protein